MVVRHLARCRAGQCTCRAGHASIGGRTDEATANDRVLGVDHPRRLVVLQAWEHSSEIRKTLSQERTLAPADRVRRSSGSAVCREPPNRRSNWCYPDDCGVHRSSKGLVAPARTDVGSNPRYLEQAAGCGVPACCRCLVSTRLSYPMGAESRYGLVVEPDGFLRAVRPLAAHAIGGVHP